MEIPKALKNSCVKEKEVELLKTMPSRNLNYFASDDSHKLSRYIFPLRILAFSMWIWWSSIRMMISIDVGIMYSRKR